MEIKDKNKNRTEYLPSDFILFCLSGLIPNNGFWGFMLLYIIMGCSGPFYNGLVTALMQEKIAPEYLELDGSAAAFTITVGLVLSGTFADRMGINNWFLLMELSI